MLCVLSCLYVPGIPNTKPMAEIQFSMAAVKLLGVQTPYASQAPKNLKSVTETQFLAAAAVVAVKFLAI